MTKTAQKWLENTVGNGEIARYEQFLLYPQCFSKDVNCRQVKTRACLGKGLTLPNDKILDLSKLKASADDKMDCDSKTEIYFGKGRKHSGKRRNCWLQAFSPFPSMIPKGYFLKVV